MKNNSVIIIGAGMGGLAAGIYGQINGYSTQIFEAYALPGGQCASWKRQGYTFDGCIHHLFGCNRTSRLYKLWEELGAMPRQLVPTHECAAAVSSNGRLFRDYYDPDRLQEHLGGLSPADAKVVRDYVHAIKLTAKADLWGESLMGTTGGLLKMLPAAIPTLRWFRPTMQQFAQRFSDPFLRQAFPLLEYSLPEVPFAIHLAKHAQGHLGSIQWPVGGSLEFARSIERRYRELGGTVHYRQRVDKILTEHGRAVGVRLADGSQYRADIVISNADGRKTIMQMLGGEYADRRIRAYCAEPADETPWAVHVFLGVNRDLAREPSSLVMLLDRPVTLAGHENRSIEMQTYGFDPTMAPPGKGVIKVELVSKYSYWKELYADRHRYDAEKASIAQRVIDLLEDYWCGIRAQVEVVDVPTLMTWERYMGGTHGFANMPCKKMNVVSSLVGRGLDCTLPGLSNFYLVGAWATSAGALFMNALSGRKVIKMMCCKDDRRFVASPTYPVPRSPAPDHLAV